MNIMDLLTMSTTEVPAIAIVQTTVNANIKYTLRNLLLNVNLYGLAGVGIDHRYNVVTRQSENNFH